MSLIIASFLPPLAKAYGFVLPYFELGAALLLFSGFFARWASLAVTLMLLSFLFAMSIAIRRGYHLDCGCFGLLYREPIGWPTLARDSVLLVVASSSSSLTMAP
jgi:hypothetical protein